ncbi:homocysteine S-methyltransferase family protein [Dongia deserti]|uniref:homocysteine S-methyltransferase family protein n=1 Tax=Dongia deserti TaxID=2268030 RepID=UPI000E65E6F5|nr:homocysteine S-methyltransferase family protein [Dongia deserti]
MSETNFTILDGGMGRELHRMGAPFKQPEWSALALMAAPDTVTRAHQRFADAGAEVITTNSYALVPFHIGEAKFKAEGRFLADLAGGLARKVADGSKRKVLVAGSLPPLFGSYRPDLVDEAKAPAIIRPLIDGLSPHVDLWLAETQSCLAEARFARQTLSEDKRAFWVSFTLDDDNPDLTRPKLRSGECVAAVVTAMLELGVDAILFNCSQPEIMAGAVDAARSVRDARGSEARIGVYANAFPPQRDEAANKGLSNIRADLTPDRYAEFAMDWRERGAHIIGGCCGIGPEHIAALKAMQD